MRRNEGLVRSKAFRTIWNTLFLFVQIPIIHSLNKCFRKSFPHHFKIVDHFF